MSASIRVRTIGMKGFGLALEAETIPIMLIAVEQGALMFEGEIKRTLTGQRTGRLYKVPGVKRSSLKTRRTSTGRSRLHQASAPGEAPAVLFGHLRNSIVHTPAEVEVRGSLTSVNSEVGVRDPALPYAERLEVGGRNSDGSRFYARPYIRPARDRVEPKIELLWLRQFR